jgi:hypothetical protein
LLGTANSQPVRLVRASAKKCDVFYTIQNIFEVREDEVDGGLVAIALGHAIATQGDTLEELRKMVRDAVHRHFGDKVPGRTPKIIRLYFVRDESMAVWKSPATSARPNSSALKNRHSTQRRFETRGPTSQAHCRGIT